MAMEQRLSHLRQQIAVLAEQVQRLTIEIQQLQAGNRRADSHASWWDR